MGGSVDRTTDNNSTTCLIYTHGKQSHDDHASNICVS